MRVASRLILAFVVLLLLVPVSAAQGELRLERVHGVSLEDTVTGESPDREVGVYLPPSYATDPQRRYPVLYLLHGIGGTHADWTVPWADTSTWNTIQDVMNRGIAAGSIDEMIVVVPNQLTRGGGSFYTNSAVTGAWEDFTVVDLVGHVDATYRTLSQAASRGITGHSMGGYGAIKLGMKHPDVFQVVYGMNSAVLGFAADLSSENAAFDRVQHVTPATVNYRGDFYVAAILCVAQALSPNPERAPLFVDLPYVSAEGRLTQTPAFKLWQKEMPLHMAEMYQDNLRALRALRFDSGRYDQFTHIPLTNLAFSERLTQLNIPHEFEDYNGDHRNRLWGEEGRIATEILPFFSRLLDFE